MAAPTLDSSFDPFEANLPSSPYPGLRPFEQHEWPVYFGRELMTSAVVERLLAQKFVVVHGDSGSGKSSLIRAGVMARLGQEQTRAGRHWLTCDMRPGESPLWGMANALALGRGPGKARELRRLLNRGRDAAEALTNALELDEDQRLCLLVDQFEELFRFAKEEQGREAHLFADVLVGLEEITPRGLYVVLTMRSEFLGRCAHYPGLAEAVNRGQYLLPRMDRAAIVRAIREPAKLYGGGVEAALADTLIADTEGVQDELPLIQHGLRLLWRKAGGVHQGVTSGTGVRLSLDITRKHVAKLEKEHGSGILQPLLSAHASQVVDDVVRAGAPSRQAVVEHLFRALTAINADGQGIRRPQTFAELSRTTGADEQELAAIIAPLRADGISFLTPYGDEQPDGETLIDISHEALIRCWKRIAQPRDGWLHREFEDGRNWQSLRMQARAYAKDTNKVLSAAASVDQAAWIRRLPSEVWAARYDGDQELVKKLIAASELSRKAKQREDEQRAEQDARQRLWKRFALAVGGVAMLALVAAIIATYLYFKSEGQLKYIQSLVEEQAMQVYEANHLMEQLRLHIQASASVTSPDFQRLASVDQRGMFSVLNLATGEVSTPPKSCAVSGIETLAFSPDGNMIAAAGKSGAWLTSIDGNRCHRLVSDKNASSLRLAFHPSGMRLATGRDDGTIVLWDVQRQTKIDELSAPNANKAGGIVDLAFDPGGQILLAQLSDGSVFKWKSASGTFEGDAVEIKSLVSTIDPRVYMQIPTEDDQLAATAWQNQLRANDFVVPGIEVVGANSPQRTELRYFRESESDVAKRIVDTLLRSGATLRRKPKYFAGHENSKQIRPLHFELWMAEDGINYWFPVIASVYDEARAMRKASSLISESRSAESWLAEFDVQVYRTVDLKGVGVFAITIGGYMAKDEVGRRVGIARKNGFPDAYSWESRFWGQNLLNDAPAAARR